ncbi:hypothetical protein GDO81_012880 [Engystomops pustulosus]|uniref:WAP domain-containing protein n=1 Tax=Engystomops pustulosus TaxID=76066 RepID=A0AAV7B033_ENGPU|nr:hypothetical protein GDO81_012880 [Engystomops pustulosus]
MLRIQVSFLGIFLCFLVVTISSAVLVKPGVCPPERVYISKESAPPSCENDRNCPGDKKCCEDNGARFCKPPAQEKGGSCPSSKRIAQCDDMCSSDSECAPGAKCCFLNCGKRCYPPGKAKPGSCPNERPIYCLMKERLLCYDDTGCPDKEKCCRDGCTEMCKEPVRDTQKPGICPQERFYISNDPSLSQCLNDDECPGNEKCCIDNGSRICKPPAEERGGSCPKIQYFGKRCDDMCTSDSECATGANEIDFERIAEWVMQLAWTGGVIERKFCICREYRERLKLSKSYIYMQRLI